MTSLTATAAAADTDIPRRSELAAAQARTGYLFVVPTMVLYTVFVLAPVVVTVVLPSTVSEISTVPTTAPRSEIAP